MFIDSTEIFEMKTDKLGCVDLGFLSGIKKITAGLRAFGDIES
jgi:hypothetical protein